MPQEFNEHKNGQNGQKIRLLFIITQSEVGGAQQFLTQLVKRLDRSLFDISIIVGSDGGNELRDILPPDISYTVAAHLQRNISPWEDLQAILQLRGMMTKIAPHVVLLLSSKAGFLGSLAALFMRSSSRPRIIYRIGGWAFNDPLAQWKKRLFRMAERISARWKDYIVVNSKKDAHDAEHFHIHPQKKLLVIPNGIDPYREFLNRADARQKLQSALEEKFQENNIIPSLSGDYLVVTIANFYPAKGLEYLIQAASYCPAHITFVIIGDGFMRPQLEQLIASLNLQKRVLLVGKLPNAAQYLSAFDMLVLPSVKEGFPWALLEAMSAKVPVVATRVGAIPEIIEHERSGLLVEPGNPKKLAHAIGRMLHEGRFMQEIPIQAHQTLLKHFNVHSMVTAYEKLFLAVAHKSPR